MGLSYVELARWQAADVCRQNLPLAEINRPDLTAEKFISHPFSTTAGARLYRTGDLARYRPDGNLEFLGRVDEQVKLRGYRIELAEIEAVLQQHPSVREAVAVVREDRPGARRLVAYIVPRDGQPLSVSLLRELVRQHLPEFMVPAALVPLAVVPLTRRGKVDRKALPAPDQGRQIPGPTSIAPQTPHEEMLAAIWAEVLGIDSVGIDDNFFDLGGHSLLATQVIAPFKGRFGKREARQPLRYHGGVHDTMK